MVRRNLIACALMLAGCYQMAGYLTDQPFLSGLGAAGGFAPFPEVFCEIDGFEPFATVFTLRGLDGGNRPFSMDLTPELFAKLSGPTVRRHVYGTALSHAPRLPGPLWSAVWCHGFSAGGPLRNEFKLPRGAHAISMTITSQTDRRNNSWVLSPSCIK